MSPIELTVPMPPHVTNRSRGSTHWRRAYSEKRDYWLRLDELMLTHQIAQPPIDPFQQASLRSVMHLGGAMDDDNALARHKPLLDWLRSRRYIADDRRKNLKWEGLPEQVVKRDGNYRIVLTLSPVPE